MTTTTLEATGLDERIIDAAIGALELYAIHLGRRHGLYEHLTEPCTVAGLAAAGGVDVRYAREWLEQQAVAGLITVDDTGAPWDRRHYSLGAEQRALLVEADDPRHVSPLADMVAGIGIALDQVAQAYRSGEGVAYRRYGKAFRDGQAGINRPAFTHDLAAHWLDAVLGMRDRLAAGGRVADIGCGAGWSTIALARAFPDSEVVGVDADEASIRDARHNAAAAAVDVRFEVADATALEERGPFDLVMILETLHDLARPTHALRAAKRALAEGGAVLVADEKVAPAFAAPGDQLERMMYGWSVVHCLPAALADQPSAALGTVLRSSVVETLARDAGFEQVHKSNIDAGFFELYALQP